VISRWRDGNIPLERLKLVEPRRSTRLQQKRGLGTERRSPSWEKSQTKIVKPKRRKGVGSSIGSVSSLAVKGAKKKDPAKHAIKEGMEGKGETPGESFF